MYSMCFLDVKLAFLSVVDVNVLYLQEIYFSVRVCSDYSRYGCSLRVCMGSYVDIEVVCESRIDVNIVYKCLQ